MQLQLAARIALEVDDPRRLDPAMALNVKLENIPAGPAGNATNAPILVALHNRLAVQFREVATAIGVLRF
jgi:hypothetical protein